MGHYKEVAIDRGYFSPVANTEPLPNEFWRDRDPVMVGQFIQIGGEYPANEHAHECETYWRAAVGENNDVLGVHSFTAKAWRRIITKAGKVIYCEACWHERTIELSRQISRVSLHYWSLDALAYVEIADENRLKTADRICHENKARRDRGKGEREITYTTFPKESGGVIFLHDDPDYLGGDMLPSDRGELVELVATWAMPPKGKRSGHGLEAWAKNGAKVTQAEVEPETAEEETGKSGKVTGGGQKPPVKGYIYGLGRWEVFKLIAESLEIEFNPKGQKIPPGFKSWELVDLLEAAGKDYATEGDVLTKPPADPGREPEQELKPPVFELVFGKVAA